MRTAVVILGADCIQCLYVRRAIEKFSVDAFYFSSTGDVPFYLGSDRNILIEDTNSLNSTVTNITELLLSYDRIAIYSLSEDGWDIIYELQSLLDERCIFLLPTIKEHYDKVRNKWKLFEFASENGISVLPTDLSRDLGKLAAKYDFKDKNYIRKPNVGSGARGFTLVRNADQLMQIKESSEYHIQPYLTDTTQFKCTALAKNGIISSIGAVKKIRYFPSNGGSLSYGECLTPSPEMLEVLTKICRATLWSGVIDTDFIMDNTNNTLYLLEVNPRLPACIKYCDYLNVDFFAVMLNEIKFIENNNVKITTKEYHRAMKIQYFTLDMLLLIELLFKGYYKKALSIMLLLNKRRAFVDIYSGTYIDILKVVFIQFKKVTNINFIRKKFLLKD